MPAKWELEVSAGLAPLPLEGLCVASTFSIDIHDFIVVGLTSPPGSFEDEA